MSHVHTLTSSRALAIVVTAFVLAAVAALVALAVLDATGADELLGPRIRRRETAMDGVRILVAGRFSP